MINYKLNTTMSESKEPAPKTECEICYNDFNKSSRAKVTCGHCDLEVCKRCVRYYLMSTTSGAHCMGCKNAWERDFTQNSLNKSFYNGDYRTKRKEMLFEAEKARFPETMPAVENYKNIQVWTKEEANMNHEIAVMREKLWELEREKRRKTNQIRAARNGEVTEEKKEAAQFIRKCPADGCEGFLSSQWKCGACNLWACSKCFAAKGYEKDAEHTCNPDDLASAELIKKETKPCPACGTRIFKISGCDQMWCTACHIAFSWRTGLRVNGVIHNPHFYAFQREGGAAVIQNPGAQICGGLPTYMMVRDRISALERNQAFRKWTKSAMEAMGVNKTNTEWDRYRYKTFTAHMQAGRITVFEGMKLNIRRLHRGAQHFQYVIIDRFRQNCQQAQDNKPLRIKFICGEIDEKEMKTQLIKRDNQYKKRQALLHVYELMMAVYTEAMIDIHNIMLECVNTVPTTLSEHGHTESFKILQVGKIQKCIRKIHNNIMKVERVRLYSNKELLKISGIYNQAVDVIAFDYTTPKFNKEKCKLELEKTNCGELRQKYESTAVGGGRWRAVFGDANNRRNPVYV